MKYVKKALAVVFWLLILALLVAPIGLIVQISKEEMQEFATPDPPVLQEMSIGGIYMATRASVSESFQVSVIFNSFPMMGTFGETRVKHSGKQLRHFAPKCTNLHLHIISHNRPNRPKPPYFRPFPTLFQVELEGTGAGLWAPFIYGGLGAVLGYLILYMGKQIVICRG